MYIYIKSGSSPADQQCCLLPLANRGTFKMEKRAAAGEIKKKLYRFPFESYCALKCFSRKSKKYVFLHLAVSPRFYRNKLSYNNISFNVAISMSSQTYRNKCYDLIFKPVKA